MEDADGKNLSKYRIYRVSTSIVFLALAVIGAHELLGLSTPLSILLGGAIGCGTAWLMMWVWSHRVYERGGSDSTSIIGPTWIGLWLVALCAFHFGVGLVWVESACIVIALIVFFVLVERYNRVRRGRAGRP